MPQPTDQELEALSQAEVLLRFAAENKQVSESIASVIAQSREAAASNKWGPDVGAKFWVAYSSLCALLKPVTWDTLLNNEAPTSPKGGFLYKPGPASRRLARLYLIILIIGLFFAIVLQFVVATGSNLATETKKMRGEIAQSGAGVVEEMAPVRGAVGPGPFSDANLTPDQSKIISKMQNQFRSIWLKEDAVAKKLQLFGFLTSLGAIDTSWHTGSYGTINSGEEYDNTLLDHYKNQQYFASVEESGLLTIGIINSALPLLLGLVGACAYVTRLISEQIKESTFSSTSSVRHLVRVALGALAGAIVGFGWIGTGVSASPLAVAFIAGYAIEPVFATVDSIAEKFR
jgi:hypothetical protein